MVNCHIKKYLIIFFVLVQGAVAFYCASDDEEVINEGLEKVKQVIKNNYVHRAEAESVKGIIRENGKHRIIDKVTVVLNEKNDEYQATFANLGLSGVPIGTEYVRKNPKLLSGGKATRL